MAMKKKTAAPKKTSAAKSPKPKAGGLKSYTPPKRSAPKYQRVPGGSR